MKRYRLIVLLMTLILVAFNGCKSQKPVNITPAGAGNAKEIYEQAKKYLKRDAERSRLLFKEIMQLYPESIYARLSKIGIADSFFNEKGSSSMIMASAEYQEYVNLYPNSPDAPYAKYQVGMCYLRQMKKPGRDQTNTHEALKHFQAMIKQFPGTKEAEESKAHIVKARQYLAAHNFAVGLANFRLKAYKGALARFKFVIDTYPEYERNDKTFFYTGHTYLAMDEPESAISFFQKVINSYPNSKLAKKSQKFIKKLNVLPQKKKQEGDQK